MEDRREQQLVGRSRERPSGRGGERTVEREVGAEQGRFGAERLPPYKADGEVAAREAAQGIASGEGGGGRAAK